MVSYFWVMILTNFNLFLSNADSLLSARVIVGKQYTNLPSTARDELIIV